MKLRDLLKGIAVEAFHGDLEREIQGLSYDSRKVEPGSLFVAVRGHAVDGHAFIEDALRRGASAVVAETPTAGSGRVAFVQVRDSRAALSALAAAFYAHPFREVNLIGITGTNGKTTTSYVLESILVAGGRTVGVLGTISYRYPGHTCDAPITTPESLDIMRSLREMVNGRVSDVVMEVSSHALDQERTRGCPFRVAVFTNFSRDHLDYHGTMDRYFEAKSRLFRNTVKGDPGRETWAVINGDDPKGPSLAALTDARVLTYGLESHCDVRAVDVKTTRSGLTAGLVTPWGKTAIRSSLLGHFNIYNILAATASAGCLGLDLGMVASGISALDGVPGRLEKVKNDRGLNIVVDYAHTPDALLKAINAVRPLAAGRLTTVFGCGGDRDKGKRAEMGRVAAENSDIVYITSDNPRTEDPLSIVGQIEEGVREVGLNRLPGDPGRSSDAGYRIVPDRREAIRQAVLAAGREDWVLIAGKGHETYQIIGTRKTDFDDRRVAAQAVREVA